MSSEWAFGKQCSFNVMIKTGTDIDTMVIPRFRGATDERLRKACGWVTKNCPGRRLTLEEIGRIMGVTRERVRQIQNIALGRLKRMINRIEDFEDHH